MVVIEPVVVLSCRLFKPVECNQLNLKLAYICLDIPSTTLMPTPAGGRVYNISKKVAFFLLDLTAINPDFVRKSINIFRLTSFPIIRETIAFSVPVSTC